MLLEIKVSQDECLPFIMLWEYVFCDDLYATSKETTLQRWNHSIPFQFIEHMMVILCHDSSFVLSCFFLDSSARPRMWSWRPGLATFWVERLLLFLWEDSRWSFKLLNGVTATSVERTSSAAVATLETVWFACLTPCLHLCVDSVAGR